jgi:hypothetical protein
MARRHPLPLLSLLSRFAIYIVSHNPHLAVGQKTIVTASPILALDLRHGKHITILARGLKDPKAPKAPCGPVEPSYTRLFPGSTQVVLTTSRGPYIPDSGASRHCRIEPPGAAAARLGYCFCPVGSFKFELRPALVPPSEPSRDARGTGRQDASATKKLSPLCRNTRGGTSPPRIIATRDVASHVSSEVRARAPAPRNYYTRP